MENLDLGKLLGYGAIGLGCILAVLAYLLLRSEQRVQEPRPRILTSIYVFMAFSLVMTTLGFLSEYATDARSTALTMQLQANRSRDREIAKSLSSVLEQKEVAALESNATPEIRRHLKLLQESVSRLGESGG